MTIYTIAALVAVNFLLAAYLFYVWSRVKVLSKEEKKPKVELKPKPKKVRKKGVHLSRTQAANIRKKLDAGQSVKSVALETGCSYTLIWQIKNGTWNPKRIK
jgi:predicted GH43/DUF377 family glycosyl hydrolase